jgi:hypothetical protein
MLQVIAIKALGGGLGLDAMLSLAFERVVHQCCDMDISARDSNPHLGEEGVLERILSTEGDGQCGYSNGTTPASPRWIKQRQCTSGSGSSSSSGSTDRMSQQWLQLWQQRQQQRRQREHSTGSSSGSGTGSSCRRGAALAAAAAAAPAAGAQHWQQQQWQRHWQQLP